jgi:hypothetical protein
VAPKAKSGAKRGGIEIFDCPVLGVAEDQVSLGLKIAWRCWSRTAGFSIDFLLLTLCRAQKKK